MAHDETPILDGALATLFLFAAHHAYGAIHYETPWRMHGALLALPLGLLLWWSAGPPGSDPAPRPARQRG